MTMLLIEIRNKNLLLTLNRPKERNALHPELIQQLLEALKTYQHDDSIRSLLIQGAGEHFCAGADIKHMHTLLTGDHETNVADAKQLAELLWQLDHFPKPVIALCQGGVMGGGMGLLAVSDIVLSTKECFFAFSEVKLGLIPAIISPYILRAIGNRAMRRYFITAEKFSADTAKTLGLVHEILPKEILHQEGFALAHSIAQHGPHAIIAAKKLIAEISHQSIDYSLTDSLSRKLAAIRQTAEAQEGFRAFIEKRSPNWS